MVSVVRALLVCQIKKQTFIVFVTEAGWRDVVPVNVFLLHLVEITKGQIFLRTYKRSLDVRKTI